MPYVVALTGGIGSGKSTAAKAFEELGIEVVDTDLIARELSASGTEAFREIVNYFGADHVGEDGELDRGRLRDLVFNNPSARNRLEAILHPAIRQEALRRIASSSGPYVILMVPLLVETGGYNFVDRVLVIDCTPAQQIERVAARSGLTFEQIRAIMTAQAPRELRLAHADDILRNEGDPVALASQVRDLHRRYVCLSGQSRQT